MSAGSRPSLAKGGADSDEHRPACQKRLSAEVKRLHTASISLRTGAFESSTMKPEANRS